MSNDADPVRRIDNCEFRQDRIRPDGPRRTCTDAVRQLCGIAPIGKPPRHDETGKRVEHGADRPRTLAPETPRDVMCGHRRGRNGEDRPHFTNLFGQGRRPGDDIVGQRGHGVAEVERGGGRRARPRMLELGGQVTDRSLYFLGRA